MSTCCASDMGRDEAMLALAMLLFAFQYLTYVVFDDGTIKLSCDSSYHLSRQLLKLLGASRREYVPRRRRTVIDTQSSVESVHRAALVLDQ